MPTRALASWSWLDPQVAVAALAPTGADEVLSLCPAGDVALSLAIAGAGSVVHLATAPAAAAVVELKLAIARALPVEGGRQILGLDAAGRRVFLYHLLREALPDAARAWWDGREALLREGFAQAGLVERHLARFRQLLLPRVHDDQALAELLAIRADSADFISTRWDTRSWRLALRAWFGPGLRLRGLVVPDDLELADTVRSCLLRVPPGRNFLVAAALLGRFPDVEDAWPALSRAGHAALAVAAPGVRVVQSDPVAFLSALRGRRFHAIQLGLTCRGSPLLDLAAKALAPGGRLFRWLASPADDDAESRSGLFRDVERERALFDLDRGFVAEGLRLSVRR